MTQEDSKPVQALLLISGCQKCRGALEVDDERSSCEDCGEDYCSRCGIPVEQGCDHLMRCWDEGACGTVFSPFARPHVDGADYQCPQCGSRHCPICRAGQFSCEHFVETVVDEMFEWLEWDFHFPCFGYGDLEELPDGVFPTPEQLDAAFRRLMPVIEAWLEADSEALWDHSFHTECGQFYRLVQEVKTPVITNLVAGWWMGAGVGIDYWSEDAQAARAEIRALLTELERGFERLAELLQAEAQNDGGNAHE